jgi:acyl-CoA synthetase (NDP forming)
MGESPESIRLVETAADVDRVEVPDPRRVAYLMQTTLAVDEADEVAAVLKAYRIPSAAPRLVGDPDAAARAAAEMGFPVVLKIRSPDLPHKSDVGGVVVGLKTAADVGAAYDQIMAAVRQHQPDAHITGVAVQRQASPGVEVIIGMVRDAQFGPVVMFGLGGILVELLEDVSFGIVPLTRQDAREMIREIKGYPLLSGYRGRPPADTAYLEEMLLGVSRLAEKHPEIQELDLNPVFAYRQGAVIVDARIIVQGSSASLSREDRVAASSS